MQYYIGTQGPFVFYGTNAYYSGPLAGIPHHTIVTEGQLYILQEPTLEYHVPRKLEIDNLEDKSRNRAYFFSSF